MYTNYIFCLGYEQQAFVVAPQTEKYSNALIFCESLDMKLVFIESEEKQLLVSEFLYTHVPRLDDLINYSTQSMQCIVLMCDACYIINFSLSSVAINIQGDATESLRAGDYGIGPVVSYSIITRMDSNSPVSGQCISLVSLIGYEWKVNNCNSHQYVICEAENNYSKFIIWLVFIFYRIST